MSRPAMALRRWAMKRLDTGRVTVNTIEAKRDAVWYAQMMTRMGVPMVAVPCDTPRVPTPAIGETRH